jgi:excisionase family DNA binding protein
VGQRREYLTVSEVADQLRVHPDSVRRWLRSGQLRGHLISRRAGYRIRPEDVRRFVEGDRDETKGRDEKA